MGTACPDDSASDGKYEYRMEFTIAPVCGRQAIVDVAGSDRRSHPVICKASLMQANQVALFAILACAIGALVELVRAGKQQGLRRRGYRTRASMSACMRSLNSSVQ